MRRCGELIALCVAACGGGSPPAAPDAAPWGQTIPMKPQLCTSGNPGDPTCPINHFTISEADPSPNLSQLDVVVQQTAGTWNLMHMVVRAAGDGLFLDNPRFTGCLGPTGTAFANIDLAPSAQLMVADQTVPAAHDLCIAFDDIGPFKP